MMGRPNGISKNLVSDVLKLMSGGTVTAVTEKEVVETEDLIEETDTEEVVEDLELKSYDKFDSEFEYIFVDESLSFSTILEQTEDYVEIMTEDSVIRIPANEMLVEEVEDLSEISKEKLQSYTKAAVSDPAFDKKRGKPAKAVVAIRTKRTKGLEAAKAKLQAIYKKESDAHMAHAGKLTKSLDDHFEANHAAIFKKHGFEKLHSGTNPHDDKTICTYAHKHDNGHVTLMSVHSKNNHNYASSLGYKHEVKAVNSKGSSWSSHYPNTGAWDDKKHDEHKTQMLPKLENHIIDVKNSGANNSGW